MRKCLYLAVCLFPGLSMVEALAQSGEDATVEWLEVTTGTSRSGQQVNISRTDISEYRVYMNASLVDSVPNDQFSTVIADIPYGDNEFYVTAVHKNGLESLMSNIVIFAPSDPVTPDPPTLVTVTLAELREACDAGLESFVARCNELRAALR